MLFKAKVVEDRLAGKIMISIGAVSVVFVVLSMLVPGLGEIVPFFISAVVLLTIVMAFLYKGDLSSYKLSSDLKVYIDGMQICQIIFPFGELSKLNFEFQSYQEDNNYQRRYNRGQRSFGLGNNLSFIYKNQQFQYQFFLQSRNHYLQFVQMLQTLYEHQIDFSENNMKGKTFLMQNVSEDEWKAYTRHYHFN